MTSGTDWIDQARRALDALRGGIAEPADGASQDAHDADCRWCPVCQVAAVVRGDRPEVTAALADVLTATATALRAFAAAGATPPVEDETDRDRPTDRDEPTDGDPPPTVQRIDIA